MVLDTILPKTPNKFLVKENTAIVVAIGAFLGISIALRCKE